MMKNENTLPGAADRVLKIAVLAAAMWANAPHTAMAQTDAPQAASSAPAGGVPAQAASTEKRTSPARRAIEFSPENIATAFKYIDKNKDGRISPRELAPPAPPIAPTT